MAYAHNCAMDSHTQPEWERAPLILFPLEFIKIKLSLLLDILSGNGPASVDDERKRLKTDVSECHTCSECDSPTCLTSVSKLLMFSYLLNEMLSRIDRGLFPYDVLISTALEFVE